MFDKIKRALNRWYYVYRNEETGRFISKEEYDALDPRDRMKHKWRRKGT